MAKSTKFGQILVVSCLLLTLMPHASHGAEPFSDRELRGLPALGCDSALIGPVNATGIIPEWYGDLSPEFEEDTAPYQINALVAADEEFQAISYKTPPWGGIPWKEAARNIIERGDDPFYPMFLIHVKILAFLTWDSDDRVIYDGAKFLREVIDETGFQYGMPWGLNDIYTVHLLIAFTMQNIATGGWARQGWHVMVIRPQAYWADDNLCQHELSHILGTDDHWAGDEGYDEDCVMSYRKKPVWLVVEDGWAWFLWGEETKIAYLTENWCQTCKDTIRANLEPYWVPRHAFGNWECIPRSEVQA